MHAPKDSHLIIHAHSCTYSSDSSVASQMRDGGEREVTPRAPLGHARFSRSVLASNRDDWERVSIFMHILKLLAIFSDIDECLEFTFKCKDDSQKCINTRGSYKCVCEEGLYWIDNKCQG